MRPADFDQLVAELEAAGKAARTIRQVVAVARSMLSDAVRLGDLVSNPASRVDMPRPEPTAGQEILDGHVAAIRAALVELAPDNPLRPGERDLLTPLAFDLALSTGLRWSELAGLRWDRVDFEARAVHVEEAIVLGESKRPKSGKVRTVPMFESAYEAFRALAARSLERGRYGPDELVLTSARGLPSNPSTWNHRVWAPAVKKAKLKGHGYRWHDLRHTTVSKLIAQGADIALVQAVGRSLQRRDDAPRLRPFDRETARIGGPEVRPDARVLAKS